MSRYIDADRLQQTYKEIHGGKRSLLIDTEPTADVRENVKGEWVPHDLENGEKSIDEDCCSVCGERFREIAMMGCEWNYCPNCGADMRGEA